MASHGVLDNGAVGGEERRAAVAGCRENKTIGRVGVEAAREPHAVYRDGHDHRAAVQSTGRPRLVMVTGSPSLRIYSMTRRHVALNSVALRLFAMRHLNEHECTRQVYITGAGASGHCHGLAANHRSVAPDPAVPVVLGHFLFVYVHPCPDRNGRNGRFLMNLMLTAAGLPWIVIPVERRDTNMGRWRLRASARTSARSPRARGRGTTWCSEPDGWGAKEWGRGRCRIDPWERDLIN